MVAVSAKSMVTPSSSSRLSAGRKNRMPSRSTTASPGPRRGFDLELCAASPEQPPAADRQPEPAARAAVEPQHAADELLRRRSEGELHAALPYAGGW